MKKELDQALEKHINITIEPGEFAPVGLEPGFSYIIKNYGLLALDGNADFIGIDMPASPTGMQSARLSNVMAHSLFVRGGIVHLRGAAIFTFTANMTEASMSANTYVRDMRTESSDIIVERSTIDRLRLEKGHLEIGCMGHVHEIDDLGGTVEGACLGSPPKEGEFIMWKLGIPEVVVPHEARNICIVKLLVPAHAKRRGFGKIRASEAKVLEIKDQSGRDYPACRSFYTSSFKYVVGATVKVDNFADNNTTCGSGIHGFMNREVALRYRV